MNTNTYRIIFSKTRGQWMAVPESAHAEGKASSSSAPATQKLAAFRARLSILRFSVLLAFGLASFAAIGQIVADPAAPAGQQPGVGVAGNGTPVVNIQAPSAAGVSRNAYQQMDVQANGVVLNNSAVNTQTQLAGWVQGNALLGGAPARVILNEVNSSNPTYLRGFIEVAGQRAQVIVANPSGISCDGCGFINANSATLTTGTPVFAGGNLESFRVERGTVSIFGAGLDASRTDYTSILARAVQVSGGLWANQLDVVAGANQIKFRAEEPLQAADVSPLQVDEPRPAVAIDVSELGGMYAGKIHLIGTGSGVGVRNAGTIGASAGDVVVTAEGHIANLGTLRSSSALAVQGEGGFSNSGTMYSEGQVTLGVAGDISNSGLLAAAGDIQIAARADQDGRAGSFTNTAEATLAAGLGTDLRVGPAGNLTVSADGDVNVQGQVIAGAAQSWSGNQVQLSGSGIRARDLSVLARNADLSGLRFSTQGRVAIAAEQSLRTEAASLQAGSLLLSGQTLHNADGSLSQLGGSLLSLNFSQSIDNTRGSIWTAGAAEINSRSLSNREGEILAVGDLTAQGDRLDNHGGVMQSGASLKLGFTAGVDNTAGQILANDSLEISAGAAALNNTQGAITSTRGNLRAGFGTLINQHGQLAARETMRLEGGPIDNRNGAIVAKGLTLDTQGGTVTNTDGSIASNADLVLHSGALDNTQGTLQSVGAMEINTQGEQLSNRASQAHQGIVAGGHLTLASGDLDNQGGIIRSWANADVSARSIANTAGNILAQSALAVSSEQLAGNGTLASFGDLSLAVRGAEGFTNTGQVQAAGRLDVSTNAALVNEGLIEAGQTLTLTAGSINNTTTGQINAATTHLRTSGNLTNRGLIDGGLTWLSADSISNLGSGRIYGDYVAIQARQLTNAAEGGRAGVIASRQAMDIAVDSIDNGGHAMIFSAGDMAFGATLDASQRASGQGGTLINHSATVESLGNMTLDLTRIENRNDDLQTEDVEISRQHKLYYTIGNNIYHAADGAEVHDVNRKPNLFYRGERLSTEFDRWDYTETVVETRVLRTDPGIIRAGGDLHLGAGQLFNTDSQVLIGGALTGNRAGLVSQGTEGRKVTTKSGSFTPFRNDSNDWAPLNELHVEKTDLVAALDKEGTTEGASGTRLDSRQAASGLGGTGAQPAIVEVGGQDTADTIRTSQPDVRLPDNSLFNLNLPDSPTATGGYLIETDPRFADYRSWLSSDAMLSALGLDPALTAKRLGDGFYEQKLVREQVARLTGHRFLDGYASDEEQYRALMDSGVSFAQAHQLVPGVALSAEQMALLTSDIVWLVAQQVRLPDGSEAQVLVPQVYARAQHGDIDGSGALIAARDIQIQLSGALANSGKLAARNLLSISADSITQQAGRMDARLLALQSTNDITLNGGTLSGSDAVVLDAGRSVIIASQSTTTQGLNATRTDISRVAAIETGQGGQGEGQLLISARENVVLTAASLLNQGSQGNTSIVAGNDITLDTVQTGRDLRFTFANGHHDETERSEVGSIIQASGTLQLQAKTGNVDARAATLAAGQALNIAAAGDINIRAGEQSRVVDEAFNHTRKSLLSSKQSGSQSHNAERSALGSELLSGGSLSLQAGRDISISASNLSAQGDAALLAKRDITLETQTYTQNASAASYERKRGFNQDLATGLNYNRSTAEQSMQSGRTVEVGSSLSAENVRLQAGRDAVIQASNVLADKDVSVAAGRNIDILAAIETADTTTASRSSGFGFNVSAGLAPRQTLIGTNRSREDGTQRDTNAVTSILSANTGNLTLAAGLDETQTAGQVATEAGRLLTQGANLQAQGQVDLSGRSVTLEEVNSTSASTWRTQSSSLTLGAQLAGSVGGMITSIYDNVEAARKTDNDRLQGALALKAGYDAAKLASAAMGGKLGSAGVTTEGAGANHGRADGGSGSAFGVSVNLNYGTSKSESSNHSSTARGTNIQGDKINITATDGDLRATGVKIQGSDIHLEAQENILLEAARNTASQQSSNSGGNYGAGVTIGVGQQNGVSFQISASQSKGKANGNETTYDNSLIEADNRLTLKSGGDTTLAGAQLKARQVSGNIGGDLNITTLQDSSQYESKQTSGGFSVSLCIPPICYGQMVSGNVNYAKDSINHNYQSAVGQSGIFAGDGGFNMVVAGNTALKGGALASDNPAQSRLKTASLSYEDLDNAQSTKTRSVSVSAGYGSSASLTSTLASNAQANALGNAGSLLAGGNKNSSDRSQTLAFIQGQVELTGTGDAATDALSQAAASTLTSRDAATAHSALTNNLTLQDASKLQQTLQTDRDNARAAQLVGQVTTNAIGDLAQQQQWEEGSWQKTTLHGLAGAVQSAIAKGDIATGALAGALNEQLVPVLEAYLKTHNITEQSDPENFKALMKAGSALTGLAVGALASDGDARNTALAGNIALTATEHNYLKHTDVEALRSRLRKAGTEAEKREILAEYLSLSQSQALPKGEGDPIGEAARAGHTMVKLFDLNDPGVQALLDQQILDLQNSGVRGSGSAQKLEGFVAQAQHVQNTIAQLEALAKAGKGTLLETPAAARPLVEELLKAGVFEKNTPTWLNPALRDKATSALMKIAPAEGWSYLTITGYGSSFWILENNTAAENARNGVGGSKATTRGADATLPPAKPTKPASVVAEDPPASAGAGAQPATGSAGKVGGEALGVDQNVPKVSTQVISESYPALARPNQNTTGNVILGDLDSLGRPTGVTAVIRPETLGGGSSANPAIRPPGFEGQEANHARGHLLANSLGGAGDDARNLVTLFQRNANHPNMSSFERQVKAAVQAGEIVSYRAIPIYSGNSPVPVGVTLTARGSNGFNVDVSIPNINGVK